MLFISKSYPWHSISLYHIIGAHQLCNTHLDLLSLTEVLQIYLVTNLKSSEIFEIFLDVSYPFSGCRKGSQGCSLLSRCKRIRVQLPWDRFPRPARVWRWDHSDDMWTGDVGGFAHQDALPGCLAEPLYSCWRVRWPEGQQGVWHGCRASEQSEDLALVTV